MNDAAFQAALATWRARPLDKWGEAILALPTGSKAARGPVSRKRGPLMVYSQTEILGALREAQGLVMADDAEVKVQQASNGSAAPGVDRANGVEGPKAPAATPVDGESTTLYCFFCVRGDLLNAAGEHQLSSRQTAPCKALAKEQ